MPRQRLAFVGDGEQILMRTWLERRRLAAIFRAGIEAVQHADGGDFREVDRIDETKVPNPTIREFFHARHRGCNRFSFYRINDGLDLCDQSVRSRIGDPIPAVALDRPHELFEMLEGSVFQPKFEEAVRQSEPAVEDDVRDSLDVARIDQPSQDGSGLRNRLSQS